MRIYDQQYTQDLRRYDLAWRLIGHQARTEWISRLTGLEPARIRTLYRSYVAQSGRRVARLRGSAPQCIDYFFASRPIQDEASAIASWCAMLDLVPNDLARTKAVDEGGLEQAEKLCSLFELYRAMPRESRRSPFSIEHLLLLVTALGRGGKIGLKNCERCGACFIVEPAAVAPKECASCRADTGEATEEENSVDARQNEPDKRVQQELAAPSEDIQRSLF
jgi:hypothetical protein